MEGRKRKAIEVKIGSQAKQRKSKSRGNEAAQRGYLKRVLVLRVTGGGVVVQGRAVQCAHRRRTYHRGARPVATATFRDICFKASGARDNLVIQDLIHLFI